MEARSIISSEESVTPPSALDHSSSEDSDDYFTSDIFDLKRLESESQNKLSDLCLATQLWRTNDSHTKEGRNNRLDALTKHRDSEYFQKLKAKLATDKKLTPGEYYYFAMVTDDVNKLDINALQTMTKWFNFHQFSANLDILIAARLWQEAKEPVSKAAANQHLRQAFIDRGYQRTKVEMYLNLRSINLSGADLSMVSLDFVDLENANLSKCNLYSTEIHFSNLDHADLSHAACMRPDIKRRMGAGPLIICSRVRNACLNHMTAPNISWCESDFTGSSIRFAEIRYGIFHDCIFDHSDFSDSRINCSTSRTSNNCSFKHADLSKCQFENVDYTHMNFTDATILDRKAFIDTRELKAALDLVNETTMQHIKTRDTSDWWRTAQIGAYQKIIAENIIYHLDKSEMSENEKAHYIDSVLDHDFFAPESTISKMAYIVERNIYTLFTSQPHEYSATEAVCLLEAERDRMIAAENRNALN